MPEPNREYDNPPQLHAERVAYETIRLEDRLIHVDLKVNHRGYHFRITEETRGKRSAIVVPVEAGPQVAAALVNLARQAEELMKRNKP